MPGGFLSFQRRCKRRLNLRNMVTVSLLELPRFAQQFWEQVGEATVFLFYGEMGAGKTTVIEALCAAKGVTERTGSPTFSIINQYGYTEDGREKLIYHMDLYRLKDEEEIIRAGVEDCLYSGQICFVEWPEKAPSLFESSAVTVRLEALNETERRINLVLPQGSVTEQL